MKTLLINQRTRGQVLLCIQERAYETCANPEFGFCTDLTSPDTGRGYMPAIPDELRSVLHTEQTNPKNFHSDGSPTPTWDMDCSTSDAILITTLIIS